MIDDDDDDDDDGDVGDDDDDVDDGDDGDDDDDVERPDDEVANIGDGVPMPKLRGSFFPRDWTKTSIVMTVVIMVAIVMIREPS